MHHCLLPSNFAPATCDDNNPCTEDVCVSIINCVYTCTLPTTTTLVTTNLCKGTMNETRFTREPSKVCRLVESTPVHLLPHQTDNGRCNVFPTLNSVPWHFATGLLVYPDRGGYVNVYTTRSPWPSPLHNLPNNMQLAMPPSTLLHPTVMSRHSGARVSNTH